MLQNGDSWLVLILFLLSSIVCQCHGWISPPKSLPVGTTPSRWIQGTRHQLFSSTRLLAALPEGYQEFGEHVIRRAGSLCGLSKEEDLTIEWKAGRIVVTVHAQSYVSAGDEKTDDDIDTDIDMDMDLEMDMDMDLDVDDNDTDTDIGVDMDDMNDDDIPYTVDEESEDNEDDLSLLEARDKDSVAAVEEVASDATPKGIDVTVLARAINAALDDGGVGFAIAETHEIEVTTPGASEELQGAVMFNAYRGFDVICQQEDTKTKKVKQIEGRLVERNTEFTIVNVKGRIKKMKNSTVLSVKLPKAKKEKGK